MVLTGKAKTDYQREYMRKRRSNARSNVRSESVRPEELDPVRPKESDWHTPKGRAICQSLLRQLDEIEPEPQSHNPMMVGYVPPNKQEMENSYG